MDLLRDYTQLGSASYYQSPVGLYSTLKSKYGSERAPTLQQVKDFLNNRKSHYLFTPRSASKRKVRPGESPRWIIRSSVGVLMMDIMFLKR